MEQIPHYQDEIDWKDLIKHPEKMFGYSYFYFLVVLVAIGYFYLGNINNAGKNAIAPIMLKDSSAFILDIPLQSPRVLPPVDVAKAGISSAEAIARGRDLFKANCSSCHGDNGQGDGPTATMLTPRPRNFHVLDGWKNGSKVTQIYKTLQEGIVGGGMASYSYLSPGDRFALIHYVQTFAKGHTQDSPEDLKSLDALYQLAKGMNVAGQMPVKKASQVVTKESAPALKRIAVSIRTLANSKGEGAGLLRKVVLDEKRILTSVFHAQKNATNVDQFVRIVSADPLAAGFKANVVRFSSEEWIALYRFLISLSEEG